MMSNTQVLVFHIGDRVRVPWGADQVEGDIVEVWGDPPAHLRVALELEEDESPEVLLLRPNIVPPIAV